jgi:hydroxymethylpyrimidine/phosphomethylpyrimidine kinase
MPSFLLAAIAAELATGLNMTDAVAGAKKYVHRAIADSYFVGPDCGVLA